MGISLSLVQLLQCPALIQNSNQSHRTTDQSLQLGEQSAMGSTTPSKPQATKPMVIGPNTTLVSQSLVQKVHNQEFIEPNSWLTTKAMKNQHVQIKTRTPITKSEILPAFFNG